MTLSPFGSKRLTTARPMPPAPPSTAIVRGDAPRPEARVALLDCSIPNLGMSLLWRREPLPVASRVPLDNNGQKIPPQQQLLKIDDLAISMYNGSARMWNEPRGCGTSQSNQKSCRSSVMRCCSCLAVILRRELQRRRPSIDSDDRPGRPAARDFDRQPSCPAPDVDKYFGAGQRGLQTQALPAARSRTYATAFLDR